MLPNIFLPGALLVLDAGWKLVQYLLKTWETSNNFKGCVKAMVFPVVMYGCESWTVISPGISLEGLMLKLKLQYLATSCEELTHWKSLWCWGGCDNFLKWQWSFAASLGSPIHKWFLCSLPFCFESILPTEVLSNLESVFSNPATPLSTKSSVVI